jgi:hypothetical protein
MYLSCAGFDQGDAIRAVLENQKGLAGRQAVERLLDHPLRRLTLVGGEAQACASIDSGKCMGLK